ncbi:MAG: hypothetical protein IMF05_11230 [Proteobacteria bacterium]|nr:hypothetical protein [Pseudomonadota bacterium]
MVNAIITLKILIFPWLSRDLAEAVGVDVSICGENVARKWNNQMFAPLFEGVLEATAGCGDAVAGLKGAEKKCQE